MIPILTTCPTCGGTKVPFGYVGDAVGAVCHCSYRPVFTAPALPAKPRPSAEDIERCEFAHAVIADIAVEMDEDETQGEEAHEYHETADALRRLIEYAKGTT